MSPLTVTYTALLVAIILETIATSLLAISEEFSRTIPTILMIICYVLSFYCLSIALRVLPVGIAYAIWSGLGIVLIAVIGWLAFGQKLDLAAIIGLGLIIAGVVVVNLFSSTVGH